MARGHDDGSRDERVHEVLRHLSPSGGFRPWHGGPTTVSALRGVALEAANWRPAPGRHTIREIALHVAYWHYAVGRRLTGGAKGGFPRAPSDWPEPDEAGGRQGWDADRRLVREAHASLVEVIGGLDPASLARVAGKGRTTRADLITGALLHDTYHAGQIQLLKRLADNS